MPTLSVFFGIVIRMYYDDHTPPHFHAVYGEFEAMITIETSEVIEGRLPRRALGLVIEWAEIHRAELRENWSKIKQHQPLRRISPLD